MKVKSISKLQGKDGKDLWKIDFEEDSKPMWASFQPNFDEGHIIDDDKLQPSRKGTSWVFKKTTEPKQEKRYAKNDDDIMLQVALKVTIELEKHHNPPNGNLDESVHRVMQGTQKMFATLMAMRPKRDEK